MRELTAAQADDLYELISERAGKLLILTYNRAPVKAHMFKATCARRHLRSHRFGERAEHRRQPAGLERACQGSRGCYFLRLRGRQRPCRRRCFAGRALAAFSGSPPLSLPAISFVSLPRPGQRCCSLYSMMRVARSASPSANLVQKGLSAVTARASMAASSFWAGWASRLLPRSNRSRR